MRSFGMFLLFVGVFIALVFSLPTGGLLAIIGGIMVLVSNSNNQNGIR